MFIEIKIIQGIQTISTPFLDRFFELITILGESYFYILLISLMYWCMDKENSRRILLALTLSAAVNGVVKELFNMPRPIGIEGIRSLRVSTATGASFPSGHTQNISAFVFSLIAIYKKVSIKIWGTLLIVLVGLSRLYLGVHWPKDVLLAVLIAYFIVKISMKIHDRAQIYSDYIPYFIVLAFGIAILLIFKSENAVKGSSILIGYILGYWIEENFINFDVRGALVFQVIKYLIGMAGLLLIFIGLKTVLPDTLLMIGLRYFLTLVWAVAGAPALFVGFKLSKHRIF